MDTVADVAVDLLLGKVVNAHDAESHAEVTAMMASANGVAMLLQRSPDYTAITKMCHDRK